MIKVVTSPCGEICGSRSVLTSVTVAPNVSPTCLRRVMLTGIQVHVIFMIAGLVVLMAMGAGRVTSRINARVITTSIKAFARLQEVMRSPCGETRAEKGVKRSAIAEIIAEGSCTRREKHTSSRALVSFMIRVLRVPMGTEGGRVTAKSATLQMTIISTMAITKMATIRSYSKDLSCAISHGSTALVRCQIKRSSLLSGNTLD